jgi:Subtilase family
MASRYLAIGSLALIAAVAASSSLPDVVRPHGMRAAPGAAHLYAVGTRSAAQRRSTVSGKMDSMLADLSRHAALARPEHMIADLHALSPAARFARNADGTAMVAIDAVTRGDPQALKTALQSLGLEHPAVYSNDVGGFLPVSKLEAAAALGELASMRAAMSHTRASTGPVATQGDYAQRSDVVRSDYPSLTGKGVTVGIISDSFNCYAVYAAPDSGVPASGAEGYASNGFTADYQTDMTTGALPSTVLDVAEPTYSPSPECQGFQSPDSDNQNTGLPFTDEGRATAQIVYAVAPGAALVFRTGSNSEADFATGIEQLAGAPYNAKVIMDDLGYFDEPFFQDGILAQAIDTVEAQGVAYFSAAGNDQDTPSYMNTSPSFATLSAGSPNAGEYLLNFDASGKTTVTSLPVTIPPLAPGNFVAVLVEWDQPYITGCTGSAQCTGATSNIDICITGSTGTDVLLDYDNDVTNCSGPSSSGNDPYQIMLIANPAVGSTNTTAVTINIQVGLANGSPAPGRIILDVEDDGLGSTINQFSPSGPTIQGHPGAAGAAAVGAAFYFMTPRCGTTPPTLEPYSSAGGAPILFDTAGNPQTPVVRQKPDFVGPDGVNNTFLGYTLASDSPPFPANGLLSTNIAECQNKPSYPNFFGTSAATPHAGAIAALMLQANPAATPTQIYAALDKGAVAMGSPTPNLNSGYGFIQADAALAQIPPGPPTLTLSAPSVTAGSSVTINWSSIAATGCTASGAWSGALKASGSQMVTPKAAGTEKYTLTCANAGGNSVAVSQTLTVTAAAVPPAPTLTLAAKSIVAGTSTTLTWSSSNATSCTASGSWSGTQKTSGTLTLTPASAGTYTYSLTCSNATGSSTPATATLTVTAAGGVPPAPTLTLAAKSITAGTSTTLTWSSSNATSCTASGSWSGTQKTSGTLTLTPASAGTYTYSLTCSNAIGSSTAATATLTVTGGAPAAPTLTLGATSVVSGTSTTITWSSSNATGCTASGSWTGPVAASGTQTLMPTSPGSYTYSLTCSNARGTSKAASVTLTVTAAPSGGGGGGGALDGLSLLGLAALFAGRRARANGRWVRPKAGAP